MRMECCRSERGAAALLIAWKGPAATAPTVSQMAARLAVAGTGIGGVQLVKAGIGAAR